MEKVLGWFVMLLVVIAVVAVTKGWVLVVIAAMALMAAWQKGKRRQVRRRPPARPVTPGARPALPRAVKHRVWLRDGGRCRHCGISDADCMNKYGQHLEYDHVVPRSWGGDDSEGNIQLSCPQYNRAKGARWAG
jgi:5-methylcytosine-specific restriction endonuclease McrA